MQKKGDADKKGQDSRQGVVDGELGAQGLDHLAPVHA